MQARLLILLIVTFALAGCKNPDKERCFRDVESYEKQRVACLTETDKAKADACTSKNEVHKMSRKDCEDAYK